MLKRMVVGQVRKHSGPKPADGSLPPFPGESDGGWGEWSPIMHTVRVDVLKDERKAEWRGTPGRPKLPRR